MVRHFKYRLYPNRTQMSLLAHALETHRQLYNAALQERREAWKRCRVSISFFDQCRQVKDIREFDNDTAWLNSTSLRCTLRRLDHAFSDFYRRIRLGQAPGFPRFQSRSRFTTVEYLYGNGAKLVIANGHDRLRLLRIGRIKVKWHRPLPAGAKIKRLYLKRSCERWYVTFLLDLPAIQPPRHPGPPVGLDLGLHWLVALSDGRRVGNPRWYRAAETRLAAAQHRLSQHQLHSHRWQKQRRQVARLHARIANQRRDFQHKLSRQLASTYALVALEDIEVIRMARSTLAKSIHDAGWGQFLALLAYKVDSTGSRLVVVDARNTSQLCSQCRTRVAKGRNDRVHACPVCGLVLDRDVNAARNILQFALSTEARTGPSARSDSFTGAAEKPLPDGVAVSSPG